jgi:hypothetical protein
MVVLATIIRAKSHKTYFNARILYAFGEVVEHFAA